MGERETQVSGGSIFKSRDAEVKEVQLWPVITVNRTIFFKYSLLLSDYSITSSIFHTKNTTIVFWVALSTTNTPGQRLDFLSLSYSQSVCFSGRAAHQDYGSFFLD